MNQLQKKVRYFIFFVLFFYLSFTGYAQQVKGVVTDETGQPLPSVNVFVKNTTIGSSSDALGQYRFELRQGVHTVVFRILGYETIEKEIAVYGNRPIVLDVQMKEDSVDLYEAVIYADRRDIAKKVMRLARENRHVYLDALQSYSCFIYRKVSLQKTVIPDAIPDTIWESDSIAFQIVLADTTPLKVTTTLTEIYSQLFFQNPSRYKEVVIAENEFKAKRPQGSISVSMGYERSGLDVSGIQSNWQDPYVLIHNAASADFNFLNPLIYAPSICEQPLLSPFAPTAPLNYLFDFDGIYYEEGVKIYRILITPLFSGDALFSGHVFVEDSSWALRGVDLSVNPNVLLFCREFRIIQKLIKINDSIIFPLKTECIYTIKDGKNILEGSIVMFYSDLKPNISLPEKTFGNEIIRYENEYDEKDSIWWDQLRPAKLTLPETEYAYRIDSLQSVFSSQEYIDSIDASFNDINFWSFIIRGVGIRNREKQSEIYFLPLLAQINPVGIGGYRHKLGGYYNKRFKNDMFLETESMIDYGFLNRDVRGKVGAGLTYVPQKFVRTYVRFGDYYEMINDYASIASIFSRSNYVRTKTLSVAQRMEIINGLFGELTLTFSDQTPIRDMKIESWSNQLFGSLNQPTDFERYIKLDVKLEMIYRFNQKYIMKGKRKILLESKWPELSLLYRKGIPGIFSSEVNYDFIELGAKHDIKLARWGTTAWAVAGGSFVNRKNLRLLEHRYFRGSDLFFFSDPLQSFQLLESTLSSSSAYFRANYMHHFEGAITNKIPLLNRLKITLAGGAGILLMEENNFRHAEIFAGIERVFRIRQQLFRIGVFAVTADNSLSNATFTYKIGINFYNPFTKKWDY